MASILEEQKAPDAKFRSRVDEQIDQATSRIRAHDLTFGFLVVAAMVAVYATAMIVLDKYFVLPEWVRQLALAALLAATGAVAYRFIVRPFRNRINPLYAAQKVERTIDDAKNSVTGYVEAQQSGKVHNAIKAAMSARAARAVVEADVNRAIDHRSLLVVGGIFAFFILALIVLFFTFRPTQFNSLFARSFAPFTSREIASRTQIDLLKPDPAEPTITNGQTIVVAAYIRGKVPAADSPSRVRVLVRHSQADPDYEEIPMKEGETSRDWQVKVPEDLVLNGFWYKVAAGDSETAEYRVTVRSLPLFTGFEARYQYPAYTRKPADSAASPEIRALSGTHVTLIARTNREVKDGKMTFLPPVSEPAIGKVDANRPDSLIFEFTVKESCKYKLAMTTTGGDKNLDSPTYAILVEKDLAPIVQIVKPAEAESELPANGQLAVDGTVGDDFGIDKVRLCLRIDTEGGGRDLAPIAYMGGQSFLRSKDNTWPRDLTYKDSADFTKLKYADGAAFEPKKGMLLEYWLEAIDNCSEAKPAVGWDNQKGNVGRSEVQRIRLTEPKSAPEEKKQLDREKDERKNEEKDHDRQQQQKMANENREEKPQDKQPQAGEQKQGEGQGNGNSKNPDPNSQGTDPKGPKQDPKNGSSGGSNGMADPMGKNGDSKNPNDKSGDPKNPDSSPPNNSDPKNPNDPPGGMPGGTGQQGGSSDPKMPPKPMGPMDPNSPQPNGGMKDPGMGGPDNSTNPTPQPSADDKKAEEQAREVQRELDRNKRPEGDAKPNPNARPEERTEPSQSKPQPKDGGSAEAQPKPEPKPSDAAKGPMGDGKNAPSEGKSEGNVEKAPEPAESKPSPKSADAKDPNQKSAQPSEARDEPLGGTPGKEKPEPKQEGTEPKNSDSNSAGKPKPATEQKDEKSGGNSDSGKGGPSDKPKDPTSGAATSKPKPEPGRGQDKTQADRKNGSAEPKSGSTEPKGGSSEPKGGSPDSKREDNAEAGQAKPQKAPDPATSKPKGPDAAGKNDPATGEAKPGPTDPNSNDPMNGPAREKPEGTTQPSEKGSGKNPPEKGIEKGSDKPSDAGKPSGGDRKDSGSKGSGGDRQEQKLDPKQMEDVKNAAKDLNNPDPKKREEAQKKLDETVGEANRKALEDYQKKEREKFDQLQKDLQSLDKATREAAEKKVDDLLEQNRKASDNDKKLDPKQMEDVKNAAKDLNNPDPKKREEAQKKLDETVGEANRKALEDYQKKEREKFDQLQKDLQSPDKATREAAEKKVDDLLEQNRKASDNDKKLDPKQMEDVKNAAKDLNNPDPKKREEAQKKLDETVGEANRKALEDYQKNEREKFDQLQKDLQSPDKATREAAEKQVADVMKKANAEAKKNEGGKGARLSPEATKELMNKAKDLNSMDDAKRQEAEKELDDKLGKENREKLQEEMKNRKPDDPKSDEELQKEIEKQADERAGSRGKPNLNPEKPQGPPTPTAEKPKPPIEDNPRNRAKAAELQLEEFEKNRYNKELQDRLGWTQDEYDRFLAAQQKRLEQLQKETEIDPLAQKQPKPPTTPTLNANSSGKVEGRENGVKGSATNSGSTLAPPGFEDAKLKFEKALQKLPPKQ